MPFVMAGLVPAIHVFLVGTKDVDARIRGHDGGWTYATGSRIGSWRIERR